MTQWKTQGLSSRHSRIEGGRVPNRSRAECTRTPFFSISARAFARNSSCAVRKHLENFAELRWAFGIPHSWQRICSWLVAPREEELDQVEVCRKIGEILIKIKDISFVRAPDVGPGAIGRAANVLTT